LLSGSRQHELVARERCTRGANRIERVVFAAKAALIPWATTDLEHPLAVVSQVASKPGTVVPSTLDRPRPGARRMSLRQPNRFGVAAGARPNRALCDHTPGRSAHKRKRVLIAMRINTDDVVDLICKHLV
jgi:hypothetical protein